MPKRDPAQKKYEGRFSCYVCKERFFDSHPKYPPMCQACGELNLQKRAQTAALQMKIALVTGARVKIGYGVALKLLRDGAFVVGTTRFPRDAAARFARETDFDEWKNRLKIYGIDFRQIGRVEDFAVHLAQTYSHLDILINNAAQTVRRPPAYYRHLMEFEMLDSAAVPEKLRAVLDDSFTDNKLLEPSAQQFFPLFSEDTLALDLADFSAVNKRAVSSAELSQVLTVPGDENDDWQYFPIGVQDEFGQQIDKRPANSWTMKLEEVSLPELIETQLISAIAPFVLISRLKQLMIKSPAAQKFIVNVSSMEGVFNRTAKSVYHPHTNMAKAALNMLTRTAGRDFAKDKIYMNAVDTGWITNENPYPLAQELETDGFVPPLNIADAVARICDPIYTALSHGNAEYGKFYKDFRASEW